MALTANEQLLDALVRHQVYLLRYSGHVRNRMQAILNATEESLASITRDKLTAFTGLKTPRDWSRMETLQRQLATIRIGAWAEANKFLIEEMAQLAVYEPTFLNTAATSALPVAVVTTMPTPAMLRSIAMSRPFEGRILKDWAATMQADDIRRIQSAIQIGMVAGEANDVIARRIVGTKALSGSNGVTELTRRQVSAITRTAVMHVANGARGEFTRANADIITQELFVATLDSRTTEICMGYDGQKFPIGKGPQPPIHYQCRSLRIPTFDGQMLGDRPAKPFTEKQLLREYGEKNGLGAIKDRDSLPRGSKGAYDTWKRGRINEMTGKVPATTSYNDWLARQSAAFQQDVLGVTKGKLFATGKLPLSRFTDSQGHSLTLGELAKREAAAFKAAGLDPKDF